jgi:hypothetical protein
MPIKSRDMPSDAAARPKRKRKSKQYKEGFSRTSTNAVANMLPFVEGEVGLAEDKDMIKPPERKQPDTRTYVQKLQPWHRKLARVRLVEGLSVTQLARRFSKSRSTVGKVVSSPLFKEYYDTLEHHADLEVVNVRSDIARMASRAVENLDDDLDMSVSTLEHRKVRQTASRDVLDRAGYVKTPVVTPGGNQQLNVQMNIISKMSKDELWEHADKMFRNLRGK